VLTIWSLVGTSQSPNKVLKDSSIAVFIYFVLVKKEPNNINC